MCRVSMSSISKSIPHFLLTSLFWKLPQPLGQDQQNSKQTYCRLPIIIFLWTPKGFSPHSLSWIFSWTCIFHHGCESFKFIVCKYICESKNWICSSLLMLPRKTLPHVFIIIPQADRNCTLLPNSVLFIYLSVNLYIFIYIIYIFNKNTFVAGMTQEKRKHYFHCGLFKIKLKFWI